MLHPMFRRLLLLIILATDRLADIRIIKALTAKVTPMEIIDVIQTRDVIGCSNSISSTFPYKAFANN